MNHFNAIHISSHHSPTLSLFSGRNSIGAACVSNLTLPNMDSLKLLARSRIVIQTICLVIALWIAICNELGLGALHQPLAISVSAQLLHVLCCSFVMGHNLVHLILLEHWNYFSAVVRVIFHLRHACSVMTSHIS